ncbi:MAG TPA: S53 family peptidase [Gaiellaceae bacterium]
MTNLRQGFTSRRVAALLVLVLAAVAVAATSGSAHRSAVRHAMTPDTLRAPNIRQAISVVSNPTGLVRFGCQLSSPAGCYGPDQMRTAYGTQTLLNAGFDGTGKTIVIIDAYGSPTLSVDLNNFDTVWGIPAPNFTQVAPFGIAPTDPANADGWAGETSLDVEWAHAIAPGAKILLVIAKSNNDSDILDATQYAIDNNVGDVVSQSFGEAEQCMSTSDLNRQHKLFRKAVSRGMTLFASSGDSGAAQPTCDGSDVFKSVSTPASDPNVTGVGGTTLHADGTTGAYQSESTWNESDIFSDPSATPPDYEAVAGGGGQSVLFHRPLYQFLATRDRAREVPDVSYNAAVFNGVIVAFHGNTCRQTPTGPPTFPCFFRFGGTSAGSPQWAAIIAIVDQIARGRAGNINTALYLLAKLPGSSNPFHDIQDGSNNSVPNFEGATITGFTAVKGYDMATGLGTPNIGAIAPLIAHLPPVTSPTD